MKIIGTTVGTTIPKPNYEQTDPAKGDYIKGDISAAIKTDATLTQEGQVADSKAVGDTIVNLESNIADTYATKDLASTATSGLMSAADKRKLDGIASVAEVNQNAFSNIVVGSTIIAADSKTDSLTFEVGDGIAISGDETNDKITITNTGVRGIAMGSANGTITVNVNGTASDIAVKGLGSAAYTASTAYDAAGSANEALAEAKTYTDNASAQKSQVQIIIWGADD